MIKELHVRFKTSSVVGKVTITDGIEGNDHDPYGFTIYKYRLPSGGKQSLKIGSGLGYAIFNNLPISMNEGLQKVEELELEDDADEICKCGGEAFWRNGYPGEELLICSECFNILNVSVNLQEVE